jgi:drug/metabolite transporter (DMT)-like permease
VNTAVNAAASAADAAHAAKWAPWAAAAVGVQVGATIVATRYVVVETGPVTLAALRYLIGLLTLLPFVWRASARPHFERADLPRIALLGIGQFALLVALLNLGLQTVPAAKGALLFASFPLLTLLVATAIGHERLSWRKGAGVALTLAGVAVALGPAALAPGGALLGEAAILASALCGAVCSVLYRPLLQRYPALPLGAAAMAAAALFLAVWAPFEGALARLPDISASGWVAIVFIGTSSGIAYVLLLWALRHADASRVTLYLALGPLTAMLLGVLWLGEPLSANLLLAVALVVGGLRVVQDRRR